MQAVIGLTPAVLAHQVIPLRDDIAQRAALVTKRYTAVHAARCLLFNLARGSLLIDLAVIHQTQRHRAVRGGGAVKLLKSMWISHYFTASIIALLASRPSALAAAMMLSTLRYGVGTTLRKSCGVAEIVDPVNVMCLARVSARKASSFWVSSSTALATSLFRRGRTSGER